MNSLHRSWISMLDLLFKVKSKKEETLLYQLGLLLSSLHIFGKDHENDAPLHLTVAMSENLKRTLTRELHHEARRKDYFGQKKYRLLMINNFKLWFIAQVNNLLPEKWNWTSNLKYMKTCNGVSLKSSHTKLWQQMYDMDTKHGRTVLRIGNEIACMCF